MTIDPVALGLEVTGKSGQWAYAKCPFHSDTKASAEFNIVSGVFYCFACDYTSTAKELARLLGGFIEELHSSALLASLQQEECEWRSMLTAPLAIGHPYLKLRKISDSQVEEFEIRYAEARIVFISKDLQSHPVGVILRRIDGGQPRYQKLGRVAHLWPADKLPNSAKQALIVEGVFGALRARQAGFNGFAQLKASPSDETLQFLNGRRIIGFLDDDLPGCIGALKLHRRGAKLVSPGGEVDEIGLAALKRKVASATSNPSHFIRVCKLAGKLKLLRQLGYLKRGARVKT